MGERTESSTDIAAMNIIVNAGEARSYAFAALEEAKKRNFEEAEALLKQSEAAASLAHQAQTELLTQEANGEEHKVNVLLVHSQDHLMTSMLASELIREIIELYKTKD